MMTARRFPFPALLAAMLAAAGAAGCRPVSDEKDILDPYAVAMVRCAGRIGTRLKVGPGSVVVLDGSKSGAAGGGGGGENPLPLRYLWRQTAGPRIKLARPDLVRTECHLRAEGLYAFDLVVRVGGGGGGGGRESVPATVKIAVRAGAPRVLPGGEPAPETEQPEGPRADFALLDSDAEELVRIFAVRTGITLRVDPEWLRPEELRERPLTFMAREATPPVALEMAARLAGGSYVRDREDAAILTVGLGWLRSERQGARFYPVSGLGEPDGDARVENLVRAACRGALSECPGADLELAGDPPGLQVSGPVSLHRRVEDVLAELAAEGARLPGRPALTGDEKLREAVMGRKVELKLINREMSEAALDLGRVLGVPVAWAEPPGGRAAMPRISIRGGGRPAREVLAEVARQAGLSGASWVAGGGAWLYRDEPPAARAEHIWTAIKVRSYPLGRLSARGVLPGVVVHQVKKIVWPHTWKDASTLCAYWPDGDRLVVVHNGQVQREVLRLLHDLLEEEPEKSAPQPSE